MSVMCSLQPACVLNMGLMDILYLGTAVSYSYGNCSRDWLLCLIGLSSWCCWMTEGTSAAESAQ